MNIYTELRIHGLPTILTKPKEEIVSLWEIYRETFFVGER